MQCGAAGHQDFKCPGCSQQFGHHRRRGQHVLKVVEQQQGSRRSPQVVLYVIHQRSVLARPHLQSLRDGRNHQPGVQDGGQADEPDASGELLRRLLGHLHREPGLTRSARTSQSDQPHVVLHQEVLRGLQFPLTADQCVALRRQLPRSRRAGCLHYRFSHVVPHDRQVAHQVAGRCITVHRILSQAPLHGPLKRRWNLRIELADGLRLIPQYRRQSLHRATTLEGSLAGRHFVEDDAQGKLVRPEIHSLPGRLLRRHISNRA